MKINSTMLVPLLTLVLANISCEKDEDNPSSPNTDPVLIYLLSPEDTVQVDITQFDTETMEGAEIVSLGDVVSKESVSMLFPLFNPADSVEFRSIFSYRFKATDGFSPFDRGREDLLWDIFSQGVIAVESLNTLYPAELGLPGAYNVTELESIQLFREVDVITPVLDGFARFADLSATALDTAGPAQVQGYLLSDLLPDTIITLGPENYSYTLKSLDSSTSPVITFDQLSNGYFLLGSEYIWFMPDSLRGAEYRLKFLSELTVE
ncbi:hypothetical protein ACFLQJ_02285 [Calditrichota bacterium]